MTYFSLLYASKQQEYIMKKEAKNQLFIHNKKDDQRKYQLIGNKLVEVKEEECKAEMDVPCFFIDLNIDQIVAKILTNDSDNDLRQLFYEYIPDKSLIRYRQDIFKDMEIPIVYDQMLKFQSNMTQSIHMQKYAEQANHPLQKMKYLLDSIDLYQDNLINLFNSLEGCCLSEGLNRMHTYLFSCCHNDNFNDIRLKIKDIKHRMEDIYYTLTVYPDRILINFEKKESDFSSDLNKLFHVQNYRTNAISFFHQINLNDLELKIADIIKSNYRSLFQECQDLTSKLNNFIEPNILSYCREMKFYLSCYEYFERLETKGFPYSYPEISDDHTILLNGVYDVNLAFQTSNNNSVVRNDFILQKSEAGAWITGANQGGKTTFARSIGQIIYFTLLGLPVPADYAKLPLYRQIFTHFSSEENAIKPNGKLKEELLHIKEILNTAKEDSKIIILNELFSSTTSLDSREMSLLLIKQLIDKQYTVLCVTHIPNLAKECTGMISLATQISDFPGHERTYRIIRKEAETTAYAEGIANKFQLSYKKIKECIDHGC